MANTPVAISGAVTIVGYSVTPPFATTDSYTFSFPYLSQDDFEIEVQSETILDAADFEFTSDYLIQLTTVGVDKLNALYGDLTSVAVTIRRRTQVSSRLVDYQDGATLGEADLDLQANQLFYLIQEVYDNSELGNVQFNPVNGAIDLDGAELANLGAPTTESSAATLGTVLDNVIVPEYTEGENYRQYRLVMDGGDLYRANTDVTDAPASISGDFDLILDASQLADIATNTAGITTNAADIATNVSDIAGNAGDITQNALDIAANSSDLTDHEAENELAHTQRDTKANLDTWAISATNGAMAYATDEKKNYSVKDGVLEELGTGGGGSLDVYHQESFKDTVATDFVRGNNATPDNAGTGSLDGSLSDETTSPLSGDSSLKYTMGSSSTNDFFLSPPISVDTIQTDRDSGFTKYYTYNGNSGDLKVIVLDQDDNILTANNDLLSFANTNARYSTSFNIPSTVTSIRYGVQVLVGNSGKVLIMDNAELSIDPFVYRDTQDRHTIYSKNSYAGIGGPNAVDMKFTPTEEKGSGILVENVVGGGFSQYAAIRKCTVDVSFGCLVNAANGYAQIFKNGVLHMSGSLNGAAGNYVGVSGELDLDIGDTFHIRVTGSSIVVSNDVTFQAVAKAQSAHVVTPAKSNLTDWTSYSPTIVGFGTPSVSKWQYKRVGDSLHIQGFITSGVSTATEARIPFPVIDGETLSASSFYDSTVGNQQFLVGWGSREDNLDILPLVHSGEDYLTMSFSSSSASLEPKNGSDIASSGVELTVFAEVKIEGWSSDVTFLAAVPESSSGGGDVSITSEPLTIVGATTDPTKGTTTVDKVYYYVKNGILVAHYQYIQTAAGSSGSGIYRLKLPNGYQVHPDWAQPNANYVTCIGDGIISNHSFSQGSATDYCRASLMSPTEITLNRVISSSVQIHSSSLFGFGGTYLTIDVRIEVPILV